MSEKQIHIEGGPDAYIIDYAALTPAQRSLLAWRAFRRTLLDARELADAAKFHLGQSNFPATGVSVGELLRVIVEVERAYWAAERTLHNEFGEEPNAG